MDPRVRRAVALIKSDLRQELSLDEMAHSLNLSASRLRHLFKAEMQMTPARYVKSLRMQRARLLLETTFLNVRQIMRRVGIKDTSHFARDFKQRFGLPPAQYREYLKASLTREETLAQTVEPRDSKIGQ